MDRLTLCLFFGCIIQAHSTLGQWTCDLDQDCSFLEGGVCEQGACVCPSGLQAVLGGTVCAEVAPYLSSPCIEDHQCSRIITSYQCRREEGQRAGSCFCQPGSHYISGRCWSSSGLGQQCTRNEDCSSEVRDSFSTSCVEGICACAEGYYLRQRGECRRIGRAVGDGCVLDEDCQFQNGVCSPLLFTCVDADASSETRNQANQTEIPVEHKNASADATPLSMVRSHGISCVDTGCPAPFVCGSGICVCPIGYYPSSDASSCLAELGSPSTEEQCVGLFKLVVNGICTCQSNFFFEENMRECTKVSRRLSDSCTSDAACHTFGAAARCGPPAGPWDMRSCECIPELAVWDEERVMCRLFAGVGERCEVDSDCMAGQLEIQCVADETGQGYCACPEGLFAVDGLCLNTGLELGAECQVSQECTASANSVCDAGQCSCATGYQQVGDFCAPVIGSVCEEDNDCVIENTICANSTVPRTCQCREDLLEYQDECWPLVHEYNSTCSLSLQCVEAPGEKRECIDNTCLCAEGHHYNDGCWQTAGIFEGCSRSNQCFLGDMSSRLECRNSICQCTFDYPYSEDLRTCTSSAATSLGSAISFLLAACLLLRT